MEQFALDKSAVELVDLQEIPSDDAYWWSRTPEERWSMIEYLRQLNYGYEAATGRMERVFEFVDRA